MEGYRYLEAGGNPVLLDPRDMEDYNAGLVGPAGAFAQEVTVSPPNVSSAEYAIRCGVILKTRIFNENPYV